MWTWLAADLNTGTIRDELPLEQAAFSVELNGAGGFDAVAPIRSLNRAGYTAVKPSTLDPGRTIIYGLRDGVPLVAAVVWQTQADLNRAAVRIAGKGIWSYYERRHIRSTLTYTGVDQFSIVSGVLGHAHSYTGGNPFDLSVGWDALSGVQRDRTWWGYERKPVAEAVGQLAEVDDGFDFAVVTTGQPGTFTHELRLWHPSRGRRTGMVWDAGKNITVLEWSRDAGRQANELTAVGAGEGDDMLTSLAADPAQLDAYPLLQDVTTHKSVTRRSTLNGHARADLAVRKQPVDLLTVEVVADDPDSRVGAFVPGDEVRVRTNEGFVAFDAACRVQSYGVTVDGEGAERVTVELSVIGYYSIGLPSPDVIVRTSLLELEEGGRLELVEGGGLVML